MWLNAVRNMGFKKQTFACSLRGVFLHFSYQFSFFFFFLLILMGFGHFSSLWSFSVFSPPPPTQYRLAILFSLLSHSFLSYFIPHPTHLPLTNSFPLPGTLHPNLCLMLSWKPLTLASVGSADMA